VKELGGVPGFIAYYGLTAVNLVRGGKRVEEALPLALEESRKYALDEWKKDIKAFLNVYSSPIYVAVLKVLANAYPSALRGAEVYRQLESLGTAPTRFNMSINISRPSRGQALYAPLKESIGLKTRSSGRP